MSAWLINLLLKSIHDQPVLKGKSKDVCLAPVLPWSSWHWAPCVLWSQWVANVSTQTFQKLFSASLVSTSVPSQLKMECLSPILLVHQSIPSEFYLLLWNAALLEACMKFEATLKFIQGKKAACCVTQAASWERKRWPCVPVGSRKEIIVREWTFSSILSKYSELIWIFRQKKYIKNFIKFKVININVEN